MKRKKLVKKGENYDIEGGKNPQDVDPGSGKWIGLKYLNEKMGGKS